MWDEVYNYFLKLANNNSVAAIGLELGEKVAFKAGDIKINENDESVNKAIDGYLRI